MKAATTPGQIWVLAYLSDYNINGNAKELKGKSCHLRFVASHSNNYFVSRSDKEGQK